MMVVNANAIDCGQIHTSTKNYDITEANTAAVSSGKLAINVQPNNRFSVQFCQTIMLTKVMIYVATMDLISDKYE